MVFLIKHGHRPCLLPQPSVHLMLNSCIELEVLVLDELALLLQMDGGFNGGLEASDVHLGTVRISVRVMMV